MDWSIDIGRLVDIIIMDHNLLEYMYFRAIYILQGTFK